MEQIEAFIEAARGPTFRAAAERCALSPAAFSRRIQAFAAFCGKPLFERDGAGTRLTDAGLVCLAEMEPAYLALRRAASAAVDHDIGNGRIALSLSHSLAVGWLIPRLDAFRTQYPGLDLVLITRRDATALKDGDADLGICYSDVDLSGFVFARLLDTMVAPVAAPSVAANYAAAESFERTPLLATTSPSDAWDQWSKRTGRPDPPKPSARFEILQAMYESAAHGQGVALGASPTVWPYLDSGRLVRLPLPAARFPGSYRLATTRTRRRLRSINSVWRWLRAEAQKTPDLSPIAAN
jgi:DNA-binding transcriptional LysR family regulator